MIKGALVFAFGAAVGYFAGLLEGLTANAAIDEVFPKEGE